MTLTKSGIKDTIHKQLGFTNNKSAELVELILEIIKRSLDSGEDVMISGFGRFNVKEKNQRKGRNPATGDSMMLSKRKVVTFRSSGVLRDKINGIESESSSESESSFE